MPSMKYDLSHCQSEVLSFADHTEELSCRGSNALSQQTPFPVYWKDSTSSPRDMGTHILQF